VVVAVAAVAITVAVQSDDSASDESTAPTTVAQVPAGPTTALPAPTPAPSAAPPTPPAAPAPAPPPAASGPVLNPDALSALLLPADQISQLMNTPGMSALPVETQLLPGTITPPQCTGVWGPVYVGTYTGTGYTGLAVQGIQRDNAYKVAQAVVSFPDPGAAKATYERLLGDWNACQNMTFNFSYQSQGAELRSGAVHPIGDVATIMLAPTTDTTIAWKQCERGMTLRGNVIVDVRACSPSLGSASYAITTAIAANVR
jgi:serine/threonine-protein kinase